MNIIQKFISKNRSYENFVPIGMVLHETANPGDNDEMEFKYFNDNNVYASAHLFVDADSATQMIPYNEVGWHCGRTGNHKYLGCELCHATSSEEFQKIWNNAVQIFAQVFVNVLMISTVTPENLPSHAEISLKYKETDHMDPINYFAQYGKTVDMFRADVQKLINQNKPHWAQEPFDFLKNEGLTINETRFEDNIKRGEAFALLVQLIKFIKKLFDKKLKT